MELLAWRCLHALMSCEQLLCMHAVQASPFKQTVRPYTSAHVVNNCVALQVLRARAGYVFVMLLMERAAVDSSITCMYRVGAGRFDAAQCLRVRCWVAAAVQSCTPTTGNMLSKQRRSNGLDIGSPHCT